MTDAALTGDPRSAALKILLQVHGGTATLDAILDANPEDLAVLESRDRNLCHALIFGVLRHRNFLDFIIQSVSATPLERLDVRVVYLLRLALFQMRFMDRIPDFAAIHTSVEMTKSQAGKPASRFVNAVLRAAVRGHADLAVPDIQTEPLEHIRITGSVPAWLARRWITRYGIPGTLGICRSISKIPCLCLRVNTLKITRDGLMDCLTAAGHAVSPTVHSPDGIGIAGTGTPVEALPGFAEGLFQVQDEAAQLVSLILDPQPGEQILDACAGLGGKTLHLAQRMRDTGQILALDIHTPRLESLAAACRRLSVTCVTPRCLDLLTATPADFSGLFDRVLVDAPCTGLGVLGRNPDTRWHRTLQDVQRLAARQKRLLMAAANRVRPGGILVFAVCSCEPEETHQVIRAFLKKRKDFEQDVLPPVPGFAPEPFFRTWPHHTGMDGFFAARLRRKS